MGADSGDVFDCLVAVTEACSNALRHGRGDASPRLSWTIDRECVRFHIQDYSSKRWSQSDHPSRTSEGLAPGDERVGGFGLELMTGLMDEVAITTGTEGTTVELAKALRSEPPAPHPAGS